MTEWNEKNARVRKGHQGEGPSVEDGCAKGNIRGGVTKENYKPKFGTRSHRKASKREHLLYHSPAPLWEEGSLRFEQSTCEMPGSENLRKT